MNKDKYAEAVEDLQVKPDNYPIWKDYDFLERGQEVKDPNDPKYLKNQITKLKHENKDFAAELDRVQRLLELQTDIEKENRQYHEQEKERVKLLCENFFNKSKDMQYKIKEQLKEIDMFQKRDGPRITDAYGRSQDVGDGRAGRYDDDNFSVNSQESFDGDEQENSIDLRILGANFNQAAIENLLKMAYPTGEFLRPENINTLVSVEFYNHNIQTTQLASGYNPQYKSQISFKNKMDSHYVRQLGKEKIKFEVHMNLPGGRGTTVLGSCESHTEEFVREETVKAHQITGKPALFDKSLHIIPNFGMAGATKIVGELKVKMRLRKPILEEYMRD